MIFYRITLVIFALFSLNILAGRDELIREYLEKLENTEIYQSYGVTTQFSIEQKNNKELLYVSILKDGNKIGYMKVVLSDYMGAQQIINDYRVCGVESLKIQRKTLYEIRQITNIFDEFETKINDTNISYFSWIGIDTEHRGKKLSYPLMTTTFLILKNVFDKEYVFLCDQSSFPNIYIDMGFIDVNFKQYMFAKIERLLAGHKCQCIPHRDEILLEDMDGNNPLHLAVKEGSEEDIRNLFDSCPDIIISRQNYDGDNVLHLAVKRGDKKIIKLILSKMGNNTITCNSYVTNNTPRKIAVELGREDIVKQIDNFTSAPSRLTLIEDAIRSKHTSLRGFDFSGLDLTGFDFSHQQDFKDAIFNDADLRKAKIRFEQLRGAKIYDDTILPENFLNRLQVGECTIL